MKRSIMLVLLVCKLLFVLGEKNVDILEELAVGSQKLTADIYREIVKYTDKNLVFSPFSVQVIMALLGEGTKGETKTQLVTGLHLRSSLQKIQQSFATFFYNLKNLAEYSKLYSSNKIYISKNIGIDKNFHKIATDIYSSEIEEDIEDIEQITSNINVWVSKSTHGKITNLINQNDIDVNSCLILVNALYLNATWQHIFHNTDGSIFYNTANFKVTVPTMSHTERYKYYNNDNLKVQFLEIPYKDHLKSKGLSMVIILPNEIEGLKEIEKNIDKMFENQPFKYKQIELQIPKFTIESKINFQNILQSLGIKNVFDGSKADFGALAKHSENIYVSNVVQKAVIDVKESGTEAAAVTDVFVMRSISFSEAMVVDHPFIYYIHREGVILFAGRVVQM